MRAGWWTRFFLLGAWSPILQAQDPLEIVDYHVHYFSPAVVSAIENQGFEFSESDYQFKPGPDYYQLERLVENNGASRMVLLSGGFNFQNLNEPAFGTAAKLENDRLAAAVHADPDRLLGFCGLDPLAGHALAEANRCLGALDMHGIKLHFPISNVDIEKTVDRQKLKALFSIAAAHKAPLLIHNSTQGLSGAAYAKSFIKAFLTESPVPLTIIFAHTGGPSTLDPFHFEFLSVMADYPADGTGHEIYFELSGILRSGSNNKEEDLQRLVELINDIGSDHFLFGSDYPMRSAEDYRETLQENLPISDADLKAILQRDLFEPIHSVAQ